ncbi:caspase-9 [Aplysia californica]|uniref:Caspase-9 n=1 Tax=Aplysia californica TaxID=6500 RepID=A0ABM1AD50_APLCA|nr:caspase-9 [Aplysia californica]XP_012945423.1 caspase-9 [Aplysia californica]XP_012945424.1 caspase-9 [Aplysia californica]
MEQHHKELIQTNYVKLSNLLSADVDSVARELWSQKILTDGMLDKVVSNNSDRKKAYALLDVITRRGPHAFQKLYECSLAVGLEDVADVLRPDLAPHAPPRAPAPPPKARSTPGETSAPTIAAPESSDEEDLPDVWPPAESPNLMKLKVKKATDLEDPDRRKKWLRHYRKSLTPKGQEGVYEMKHRKRGSLILINNEKFDHMSDRDGTQKDRLALDSLFRRMNFNFIVHSNKTSQVLLEVLEEEARKDYSCHDCVVVILLSHGHKGVVFGTDGKIENGKPLNCVEIEKITKLFRQAPSLYGKPKLFFVQACQGNAKDSGVAPGQAAETESGDSPGKDDKPSPGKPAPSPGPTGPSSGLDTQQDSAAGQAGEKSGPPTPKVTGASTAGKTSGPGKDAVDSCDDEGRDPEAEGAVGGTQAEGEGGESPLDFLSEEEGDAAGEKLPGAGDVFIGMATPPDFLSWRRPDFGTWFIQALVEVFAKWAYKLELDQLMTKVNQLVTKAATKRGSYKQVGEKRGTLTKSFYFFPGLYEDMEDL